MTTAAETALSQAYHALRVKDPAAARHWAEQAAGLEPNREEPWLILAAVASPHARVAYLERALQINPANRRTQAELAQARQHLRASAPRRLDWSPSSEIWIWIGIGMILLAVGAWSLWLLNHLPPPPAAALAVVEPTATWSLRPSQPLLSATPPASATPRPLPAAGITPTAASTPTNSPTPAPTLPPTATPGPTSTPVPVPTTAQALTYVVQAGDTLVGIAQMFAVEVLDLMIANHIPNADRIQIGETLTIPPGARVVTPRPVSTARKRAVVVLSEQRMYAYQDNQAIYTFVVSTGRGGGTLPGSFTILDKTPNAYSDLWGFWMPYWLGIYYVSGDLENGIHSLPVLADGSRLWGDALGTPVSYGCVILGPTDAKIFYEWAEVGMPVIIQD